MARRLIYTCDRCKKEYTERDLLSYDYTLSIRRQYKDGTNIKDLCIDCQRLLEKWMEKLN